jgi:HEAT repeat protein
MEGVLVVLFLLSSQGDPISGLIDSLSSDRVEVREEACRRLEELGDRALPSLRKAAAEGDEETSARAKELLERIPLRSAATENLIRAVPGVVDRLVKGEPADVFLEIAQDLRAQGADRRYPALRPQDLERLAPLALRVPHREGAHPDRRVQVCEEIGRFGFRTAFAEAVGLLSGDDDALRAGAARLLKRLDATEAVPELGAAALGAGRPELRLAVATVLASVNSPEGIPILRVLLRDPDARVRLAAIVGLRENRGREAGEEVALLLSDPDPLVRSVAAHAVGRLEVRSAVPALAGALGDPSPNVRWWAGRALAELDSARAVAEISRRVAAHLGWLAGEPARFIARGGFFP